MPRNSSEPSWPMAWTPKLFAGIAALMKREPAVRKETFPASTRRRTSSSSPSYHTCRLLLASNSRWLSKSTLTWSRWPTTPAVRMVYWGFGVMVGKPALQPEMACCRSNALQRRLRNWSALSSKRTLSCIPMSAYVPSRPPCPAAWKTGLPGAPGAASVGGGRAGGAAATALDSATATPSLAVGGRAGGGGRRAAPPPPPGGGGGGAGGGAPAPPRLGGWGPRGHGGGGAEGPPGAAPGGGGGGDSGIGSGSLRAELGYDEREG